MLEYGVKITYIKGVENIVADVLSRYPTQNDPELEVPAPTPEMMADLFAMANDLPADAFPLSFKILSTMQQQDPLTEDMLNKQNETRKHLSRKTFHGGEQLVCYDEKIYVPPALRNNVVTWYHEYLCHPGETRTEETIRQHLWWPGLRTDVRRHVDRCPACQRGKKKRLKYGHLPPKEAEYKPWEHLCVDTIGPYRIRRKGKKELVFQAVTFMDPATGCNFKLPDSVVIIKSVPAADVVIVPFANGSSPTFTSLVIFNKPLISKFTSSAGLVAEYRIFPSCTLTI